MKATDESIQRLGEFCLDGKDSAQIIPGAVMVSVRFDSSAIVVLSTLHIFLVLQCNPNSVIFFGFSEGRFILYSFLWNDLHGL